MARIPIHPSIASWAAQLYRDGKSTRTIAKQLGVSPETVRRALTSVGVEMRSRLGTRSAAGESAAAAEAVHLAAEGMSNRKIAAKLGIGVGTVSRTLVRKTGQIRPVHKNIDPDKVWQLWMLGRNKSEIARELGCSNATVNYHLKKMEAKGK